MIIKHRGIEPDIDPTAYVAPNATIIGNVQVGAHAKVMFGAVINSEGSSVSNCHKITFTNKPCHDMLLAWKRN